MWGGNTGETALTKNRKSCSLLEGGKNCWVTIYLTGVTNGDGRRELRDTGGNYEQLKRQGKKKRKASDSTQQTLITSSKSMKAVLYRGGAGARRGFLRSSFALRSRESHSDDPGKTRGKEKGVQLRKRGL